jgi:hypothetical protein
MQRLAAAGVAVYAVALVAIHTVWSDHIVIVWTGTGIATAGLALAALVTAWVKLREYIDKTDELEEKVNGGLEEAARTHLQDNEMFESLIVRVDRLEADVARESTLKEECEAALTELRAWVIQRLDETGNGRGVERTQ